MSYMDNLVLDLDMSTINPVDFSGNGNNGTGVGLVASTDIVDGIGGGKCIEFNGTDERVRLSDMNSDISGLSALTASFLIKPTSVSILSGGILALGENANRQLWFYVNNTSLVASMHTSDSTSVSNVTGAVLTVGKWMHVAVVYDNITLEIYIDAVKDTTDTSKSLTGTIVSSATDSYYIAILPSFNLFAGSIDKVKMFPKALTAIQVKDLYNREQRSV